MRKLVVLAVAAGSLAVAFAEACKTDSVGVSPEPFADASADDTGASSSSGAVDVDAAAELDVYVPPFVPSRFDVNHLLGTGQSLSVGALGTPPLSTTQPFDNLRFDGGATNDGTGLGAFAPLTETGLETLSSGLANLVRASFPTHRMLVSGHGVNGAPYATIKKGTAAYAHGMAQVNAAKTLCAAQMRTYVVRGVTNVHGETDSQNNNASYEANLVQWQHDYETDVRAITGQTEAVPMFESQISSWTKLNQTTSVVVIAQLSAAVNSSGKIVLVGPKYMLPYVVDGVHLTNRGYQQMGEYYAKAYRRVVLEGAAWEPLRPVAVTRNGAEIRVRFVVPAPPLAFDTTLVSAIANKGFEYTDGSATPPLITSVVLDGADTVKITLASTPTGANKRVRYAYTGTLGAAAGATTGPRGNLRDSDVTPSRNGYPLYNWSVHFDEAVP